MEGVVDIEIDIKTYYSQDGASLIEIMEEINNAGFDADNKKTTKASGNPCRGAKIKKIISCMQSVFKGYVVIVRRFKSAFERLLKNLFFCPVTFEGRIKKFLFKNQIASKIFL
jgi:hypothetical protein